MVYPRQRGEVKGRGYFLPDEVEDAFFDEGGINGVAE
jgi:hypothetical protein